MFESRVGVRFRVGIEVRDRVRLMDAFSTSTALEGMQ